MVARRRGFPLGTGGSNRRPSPHSALHLQFRSSGAPAPCGKIGVSESTESATMRVRISFPGRNQPLRAAVKNFLPAIVCPLTLLACYFVIQPYAEIGIIDDWSYIKTAQVLAQTGHIAYNGWGSPMLGWQIYFGALFIKLFGFSFTAVRFCTVMKRWRAHPCCSALLFGPD